MLMGCPTLLDSNTLSINLDESQQKTNQFAPLEILLLGQLSTLVKHRYQEQLPGKIISDQSEKWRSLTKNYLNYETINISCG